MKRLRRIFAGFFLSLFLAAPVWAFPVNWRFAVENEFGTVYTSGITAIVFQANSFTTQTIYNSRTLATITDNPVTPDSTTGVFSFWIDSATSSVDVFVFTNGLAGGDNATRRAAFTANDHRVILPQNSPYKHLAYRYRESANQTTEVDTTIDLPEGALVTLVYIQAIQGNTGSLIDVGTLSTESGGDANGFCAGTDIASAGWTRCSGALITTAGVPHRVVAGTQSLTFTLTQGRSVDGYIHIFYIEGMNR